MVFALVNCSTTKVFIGQLWIHKIQFFYAVLSQIILKVVHIFFADEGYSWTSRHRLRNILDLLLQVNVKIGLRIFFHNWSGSSWIAGLLHYKCSQIKILLLIDGSETPWISMLKCWVILLKNRRHFNLLKLLLFWRVVPIFLSLFLNFYLVVDALHINLWDLL